MKTQVKKLTDRRLWGLLPKPVERRAIVSQTLVAAVCGVIALPSVANASWFEKKETTMQGSWQCGASAMTFENQQVFTQILYGDQAGGATWGTFDFVNGQFRMQTNKVRLVVNDLVQRGLIVQDMAHHGDMAGAQTLMQQGYFVSPINSMSINKVIRLDADVFEYQPVELYKNGIQEPLVGQMVRHCEKEKPLTPEEKAAQEKAEAERQAAAKAAQLAEQNRRQEEAQRQAELAKQEEQRRQEEARQKAEQKRLQEIEAAKQKRQAEEKMIAEAVEAAKTTPLPTRFSCVNRGQPIPPSDNGPEITQYTIKNTTVYTYANGRSVALLGSMLPGSTQQHIAFAVQPGQRVVDKIYPAFTMRYDLDAVFNNPGRPIYDIALTVDSGAGVPSIKKMSCWGIH